MVSICGYTLEDGWEKCANGEFTFATKGRTRYFLKKLPQPKYPSNKAMYNAESLKRKMKECADFEKDRNEIYGRVRNAQKKVPLIMAPQEIIRDGASYILVCPAIGAKSLDITEIARLSESERFSIMADFADILTALDEVGVIHGDIKPSNVFVVKADGRFRPMLTDFDDCYLSGKPPEDAGATMGSPEFYSPEIAKYVTAGDGSFAEELTTKSDVFAAGILFFYYYTGRELRPSGTKSVYPFDVDFADLDLGSIPKGFMTLLASALCKDYRARPTAAKLREQVDVVKSGGTVDVPKGAIPRPSDNYVTVEGKAVVYCRGGRSSAVSMPSEAAAIAKAKEFSEKYGLELLVDADDAGDAAKPKPDTGEDTGADSKPGKGAGSEALPKHRVEIVSDKLAYIYGVAGRSSASVKYALEYADRQKIPVIDHREPKKEPVEKPSAKITLISDDGRTVVVKTPSGTLSMSKATFESKREKWGI